MIEVSDIIEIVESLAYLGDCIRGIVGLFALYGVYSFFCRFFYKKINLSIGSFRISYYNFDVQKVTNVVSAKFYDGGPVPAAIRKEILQLTIPKIKDLKTNIKG